MNKFKIGSLGADGITAMSRTLQGMLHRSPVALAVCDRVGGDTLTATKCHRAKTNATTERNMAECADRLGINPYKRNVLG